MSKIELININKSYDGNNLAVKDINFNVNDGEFVVLLGPSGCGKSTILRMIAGLEEISGGKLLIDGKLANKLAPHKREIGMVFQNYALYPHLTVYQNLSFPLEILKKNKKDIKNEIEEITEIVGLNDLLQRKPSQLSGGQRQRVALGRALIKKPKIFLFDEPLSNLDAKLRSSIRNEILKIHRYSGSSSLYVTHDQNEAMTMADKIVLLDKGEIVQIDDPQGIYNKPRSLFAAKFMGYPEINIIDKSEKHNFEDQPHLKSILENSESKSSKIGIRSENLEIIESTNGTKPTNIEFLGVSSVVFFEELNIKVTTNIQINSDSKYILKLIDNKAVYFDKNDLLI